MEQHNQKQCKPERQTVPLWPDAAQILGIGRNVAYDGAKSGQIPTIRIGKRILVSRTAINRLLSGDGTAA